MFWEIVSLILFILLILVIIFNAFLWSARIDPALCPTVVSDFGVTPDMSAAILTQCGSNGASTCTFTNVTSLSQAVDLCNQNAPLCNLFIYSPVSATMSIADPNSAVTPSTDSDLYQRQFPTVVA